MSVSKRPRIAELPSPLEGIRVVEVAGWLAAPSCAMMLRDMGADVIKVEPLEGDAWRRYEPDLGWGPGDEPHNPGFHLENRGKRSIAIDLGRPEGREIVLRLASHADVFVTNLTPVRAKRYGVTYGAARRGNPRLIYLQLTGYGVHGPDKDRPGFDDVAFWASSGIMSGIGYAGSPPVQNRASMGDRTTGLALLAGVLTALYQRESTGKGQFVQGSLLATGMWAFGDEIQGVLETGSRLPRTTREAPEIPTHNAYRLRDGRWIMIAMGAARYFPRLCRALGHPELAQEPGLDSEAGLVARSAEVTAKLDAIFATKTLRELAPRFRAEGLIWSAVSTPSDVLRDPQVRANGIVADIPGADYRTLNMPVRFEGSRVEPRGPAPGLGEHTDDVLADLGYDAAMVAALRAAAVVA